MLGWEKHSCLASENIFLVQEDGKFQTLKSNSYYNLDVYPVYVATI
jgi:hypothetical protein